MWPFRKKTPKPAWEREGVNCTDQEKDVLARLFKLHNVPDNHFSFFWGRDWLNYARQCPYCGRPVVELCRIRALTPVGSARAVKEWTHDGFFCLRCGAELVCGFEKCGYRIGSLLFKNTAHWVYFLNEHESHSTLKINRRKNARNLFDILDRLEKESQTQSLVAVEPDLQDEHAKLEARLDEIAAEKLELEEEDARVRARMKDINIVFAAEALELAEVSRLEAAVLGDREIVVEAEAVAAQLAPAADEGDE